MRRITVENAAHFYNRAGKLDFFAEGRVAIGGREDRFADVETDFTAVDVKSSEDLDIAWPVETNLPVHQSHASAVSGRAVIEVYSLNKRAGTISNPDNGDSYFSHC